ncbi:hypothetical protein M1D30_10845 [Prevotella sp. E15-22]|uniref:hypothetical protein n=1 Tax=Prevotella sp. E15-22 TaxID=2937774 RepID=UPI00206A3876|nr:hypothetical protein [Prevotella sp. E15-22]UPS44061.1 hypothetical protein M1D30_10845 [Prevotella sp. E15-22]
MLDFTGFQGSTYIEETKRYHEEEDCLKEKRCEREKRHRERLNYIMQDRADRGYDYDIESEFKSEVKNY